MKKIKCTYCNKSMELVRNDEKYFYLKCENKHKKGIGRVDHVVEIKDYE